MCPHITADPFVVAFIGVVIGIFLTASVLIPTLAAEHRRKQRNRSN